MTTLTALRALIRILDKIGGYMTHEDQQALFAAREIAKTATDFDGIQLRGDEER